LCTLSWSWKLSVRLVILRYSMTRLRRQMGNWEGNCFAVALRLFNFLSPLFLGSTCPFAEPRLPWKVEGKWYPRKALPPLCSSCSFKALTVAAAISSGLYAGCNVSREGRSCMLVRSSCKSLLKPRSPADSMLPISLELTNSFSVCSCSLTTVLAIREEHMLAAWTDSFKSLRDFW
jgi:hypothetical protein